MKTFYYLIIFTAVFALFSCEKDEQPFVEPLVEAKENGRLFSYKSTAGFKNREFHIKLFSQDAKYHTIDIFLEDFKEETFFFGINTFSEVRIGDFYLSSDVKEPNSGYFTIESINWQDSTFDAVFEFEAWGFNDSPGGGKWENGVLKNIPFSNLGGSEKKLHRLSMKIDGEQYSFRCPNSFWTVSDSLLTIGTQIFMSGHEFFFQIRKPANFHQYDLEELRPYDLDFKFPNEISDRIINVTGDVILMKDEPNDFEARFDLEIENEYGTHYISRGIITVQ